MLAMLALLLCGCLRVGFANEKSEEAGGPAPDLPALSDGRGPDAHSPHDGQTVAPDLSAADGPAPGHDSAPEVDAPQPPACGGTPYGGHCWYLAGPMASCNTACTTHGGCSNATLSFAGSSGTPQKCAAVMTALGIPGGTMTPGTANKGLGCVFRGDKTRWWIASPPTNAGDTPTIAGSRRICACKN